MSGRVSENVFLMRIEYNGKLVVSHLKIYGQHEIDIHSQYLYIFVTKQNSIPIFLDSLFSRLSIVCIARSVFKHPFKAKYIILHLTKCHLLYQRKGTIYELWIGKEICVIKAVLLHTYNNTFETLCDIK